MTVSIERGFHLAIDARRRGGYRVALRRGKAPTRGRRGAR